MTRIDIIVAVRDEELNIPRFLESVAGLDLPEDIDLRVLFVEDSSTDETKPLLRRLSESNPRVAYYFLEKGFGQGRAVAFGLSRSKAHAMVMMDVDGSHPVAAIPEMIRHFLGGAQVVQCVRRSLTKRATYRRLGTALFQSGAKILTGVDTREQNVFYRLVSAKVAHEFLRHPRYFRFLRLPLPRKPEGTLATLLVDCEERTAGNSKYNFYRLLRLALDGILSLISKLRFSILSLVGGVAIGVLFWGGFWPLALAGALAILLLAAEYITLQHDTLDQIQVSEHGGWDTDERSEAKRGG